MCRQVFSFNFFAIIPLAWLIGKATEAVLCHDGAREGVGQHRHNSYAAAGCCSKNRRNSRRLAECNLWKRRSWLSPFGSHSRTLMGETQVEMLLCIVCSLDSEACLGKACHARLEFETTRLALLSCTDWGMDGCLPACLCPTLCSALCALLSALLGFLACSPRSLKL